MMTNASDDVVESCKAKYWAICWILSIVSVCTFLSLWAYFYYAYPNPVSTVQIQQVVQNQAYLDKKVNTIEATIKDIKIIADIKKKYEDQQ